MFGLGPLKCGGEAGGGVGWIEGVCRRRSAFESQLIGL